MFRNYLLLLLLLLSGFASAQFPQDSLLNYVVDDATGSEQSVPLTATTANGNTFISWFDNSSGQYRLKMQLLDMDGIPQWAQGGIVVSAFPQNSALFRYDLEADNDGNAIVAFQDERSGSLQVVAYKISSTGASLWGNGILLQDSTSDGLSPRVTVTTANDVIIAWNAAAGSSKWVAYAKVTSGGQLNWIKRVWNGQKYSRAVMLPAAGDGFKMLYVQESGGFPGGTSTMYLQHFDSSGTALWPSAVLVSSQTISFFFFPEIISDHHDGVYIAFNTGNPINPMMNDVYAQHIDSAGVKWSSTGTQCANSTTEHKLTGGFATNSTGTELYVALQVLNSSQGNSGISLQKLNSIGGVQLGSNAMNLRPVSSAYYLPVGIVDEGNGVMIAYILGGFGSQTLQALSTDYNGTALWGYDPMIAATLSNKDDVSCGPYLNGQVVLVWSDDRIDGGIYAQNIFTNGAFGPHVGLEEHSIIQHAVLFPNPAASPKISILSETTHQVIIRLLSITGQTGYEQAVQLIPGSQEIPLNYSGAEGFYAVQIISDARPLWCGKWINCAH